MDDLSLASQTGSLANISDTFSNSKASVQLASFLADIEVFLSSSCANSLRDRKTSISAKKDASWTLALELKKVLDVLSSAPAWETGEKRSSIVEAGGDSEEVWEARRHHLLFHGHDGCVIILVVHSITTTRH